MSKATEIHVSPDEAEAGGTFADFFAEGYPRLVRAVLPATRIIA